MIHFLIDQRLRTKQVEEQGDRSNLTDISASFGNQQTTPLLTYRSKIWRFPKSWGYPKWMVYKGKSIYKWMIHMKNHPELAKMFGLWFFSTLPKKSWSTGLTSAIHCLSHKCTGPIFFFAPVFDFQCVDEWIDQWSTRTTTVPMDNHYGYYDQFLFSVNFHHRPWNLGPFPGRQADEWLEQTRGPDQGAACFWPWKTWLGSPAVSWKWG